jgi:hypothetical protein
MALTSPPQPATKTTRRSRREEQFEADQDVKAAGVRDFFPRNGQAPRKDVVRHRLDRLIHA